MNTGWQDWMAVVMLLGSATYLGMRTVRRFVPGGQYPGFGKSECGGCEGCKAKGGREIQLITADSIRNSSISTPPAK